MKITLKKTPEQVALVKAMGSNNRVESLEAQEAFAAFLGPVVAKVLNQAATASRIYTDSPYDADDSPSFPLDLYYNESDNYFTTWSQNTAGGLPSSQDVFAGQELKMAPYRLDSAVSFLKKYARRGRLDVLARAIERMAQEVLVKQERNAWAVILKAVGEASTNGLSHVLNKTGRTNFRLDDLNTLMTRMRRINTSFADGTPADSFSKGVTDIFISPEVMEDIRGFSYNAVNGHDYADPGVNGTDLPESAREDIYRNVGASSIFNVNITELNEFGIGKKYNTLFDNYVAGAFSATTDDLIVGVDVSKGAFIRAIAEQDGERSTFVATPDDQFNSRSEKLGWYGSLEEARVCVDGRAVMAVTLEA